MCHIYTYIYQTENKVHFTQRNHKIKNILQTNKGKRRKEEKEKEKIKYMLECSLTSSTSKTFSVQVNVLVLRNCTCILVLSTNLLKYSTISTKCTLTVS